MAHRRWVKELELMLATGEKAEIRACLLAACLHPALG